MGERFVVQVSEGCWLDGSDGDPGRTMVLSSARQWRTAVAAQRALNRAKRENQHRTFRESRVVAVDVTTSEPTAKLFGVDEPFTVDWLVEIGGEILRDGETDGVIGWNDDAGWLLAFNIGTREWSFRGESIGEKPITTRRDVLKWLDVLGIVPATEKPT